MGLNSFRSRKSTASLLLNRLQRATACSRKASRYRRLCRPSRGRGRPAASTDFSVHNQIRVKARDAEGRKQLACYMIRNPFALEKMTYDKQTGMVIYRSKFHASLKRNYQLLPAVQWLTLLLAHIPDKYEHLIRYYGWYSNRARGERNTDPGTATGTNTLVLDETPADRKSKANWARLIQKVYEVDPLECPRCRNILY
ncbi:MAG: transposase [Gammaproteobacteria bacterium]|nr:transposase [Gammaproteobacteria bacterium]